MKELLFTQCPDKDCKFTYPPTKMRMEERNDEKIPY